MPGERWFVDETYVKVNGRWTYLNRAVDQFGQVIDGWLSTRRDLTTARAFLHRARPRTGLALWERQDEIFERINPRPALLRLGQWWRCDTGHWLIRPKVIHSYLQRARHGYSDRDTWDLGAHLAEVIAGSVERFAELTNGYRLNWNRTSGTTS